MPAQTLRNPDYKHYLRGVAETVPLDLPSPKSRFHYIATPETREDDSEKVYRLVFNRGEHRAPRMHMDIKPTNLIYVSSGEAPVSAMMKPVTRTENLMMFISGGSQEPFTIEDQFETFRRTVMGFAKLKAKWDTYASRAPSEIAIAAALRVLNFLRKIGEAEVKLDWAAPTGDGSIILQYRAHDAIHRWEFESDGDIAVMKKIDEGEPIYLDVEFSEIGKVLHGLMYADVD